MQYFMLGNCYRSRYISSKCLPYLHQQLGEMRNLCKVDSTHAQWWPKCHVRSSCHVPSAMLEKWRQCFPRLDCNGWRTMGAFIWLLAEMTEGWMVCPNVMELWKSCTSCSSAEVYLCLTIVCQFIWQPMASITAYLQDKVKKLAVCH